MKWIGRKEHTFPVAFLMLRRRAQSSLSFCTISLSWMFMKNCHPAVSKSKGAGVKKQNNSPPIWSNEEAEDEEGSLWAGLYSPLGFSTSSSNDMRGPPPCNPTMAVLRPLQSTAPQRVKRFTSRPLQIESVAQYAFARQKEITPWGCQSRSRIIHQPRTAASYPNAYLIVSLQPFSM